MYTYLLISILHVCIVFCFFLGGVLKHMVVTRLGSAQSGGTTGTYRKPPTHKKGLGFRGLGFRVSG